MKDRQLGAGGECQLNNDSETQNSSTIGHLSVMSLLKDVESTDLQYHSIHMTSRSSPSYQAYCAVLYTVFQKKHVTTFLMIS